MKQKSKNILIGISLTLALLAILVFYFLNMMGKPLYESGMVRAEKNLSAPLIPPMQDINDTAYWKVEEDIKLFHFSEGNGEKVLVIHGGPGYPYSEPPTGLSLLTDQYEVIFYDQRGCGKSSRPFDTFESTNFYNNMMMLDKKLGLGAQIADIERIRQILKEDKLTIIGHSFGAFLAVLYAAEFPEHVSSLVLVAPADVLVLPNPNPENEFYTTIERLLPDDMKPAFADFQKHYFDFQNVFKLSENDLVDLNDDFAEFYMTAIKSRGINIPDVSSPGRSGGWMPMGMYFSMGKKCDYRAALKKVEAPALVIHSEKDLQAQSASMVYVNALSNARLKVIKNASHFPFEEQPEEFAKVVRDFYKELKSFSSMEN